MKPIIILILLTGSIMVTYGQSQEKISQPISADSIEVLITKYKGWLDKGIITENEYAALKAKLLSIEPITPLVSGTKTISQEQYLTLRKKYSGGFIPAGVAVGGGVGLIIAGKKRKERPIEVSSSTTADQILEEFNRNQKNGKTMMIVGGTTTGIGAIMFAIFGGKIAQLNKRLYNSGLSINVPTTNAAAIGFAWNFESR